MIDRRPLLDRLAERRRAEESTVPAGVLTPEQIGAAEERLGFRLPQLLASIYGQLADGGFGPDFQLFGLAEAADCYARERAGKAGTEWAWPEGVLPILDWGCAMYAAVDCRSEGGRVLLFEPNPGDPEQAWWVDSDGLEEWFEHYLNDDGWWTSAEAGEDFELEPWPEVRARV